MNKTYYPSNLVTTIRNSQLDSKYKKIGLSLYDLAQTYVDGSLTTTSTTDLTTVISQLQDKIILFFQAIDNIDPMLVLTCNYYYYNSKKNIISKIKKETHPLYELFNITFSATDNTTFSIEISESKLFVFLLKYVYFNNVTAVNDTIITNFKYLFMGTLQNYLSNNTKTVFTYDHYSVNMHTTKNLSYLNTQGLYHDFNSQYNFFIKEYENIFSSGSTVSYPDSIIPNYYANQIYLHTEENKERFKNLVSLDGKIEVTEQTILSKEYFIDYSKVVKKSSPIERDDLNKVKNYILDSHYSTEQNNTLSSENFPYTAKIKFSNYATDSLIEVLESKKLDTLTANNCHYIFSNVNNVNAAPSTSSYFTKQQNIFKKPSEGGEYIGVDGIPCSLAIKNVFSSESVYKAPVSDIYELISKQKEASVGFKIYNQKDFSFMTTENLKYLDLLKKPASVFHYIHLKTHLEQICNKSLDYSNVLNLSPLDVYPICFQIEKYNTDDTLSNTVTIARNSTNSEVSFYDTQLAYEKTYRYKVYSLNLVNSFKYSFTDLTRNLLDNIITGTIKLEQDCYVYKNLVIDKKFEIYDDPPTPVDVNIVPLINSPNRMLFLFNTQSTKLLERPKIISIKDTQKFLKIRQNQNLNSKDVLFETVEDLRAVQVFRTTTPPKNYRSFENSQYRVLTLQRTTANNFVDTLEQNVKYYYTFRSIDVHNNFSNPTEVFEVQIINNDGAIYPIVKTYNMKDTKEENYEYRKSFKKYISINPSVLFTQLVNGESDVVNVGTQNGFWNDNFKLRIKSKQSGRCFDVNLSFNKIINNLIDQTNTFETTQTTIDIEQEDTETEEMVLPSPDEGPADI